MLDARLRLSEAKILSRVNHPHVVTVFDAGETDGMLWIAMERLHGRPLSALLGAGRVPPERVVALAVQVCDALHATHVAGATHRDLKPENIFLLPGDRDLVKVLDFGIARSEADHTGTTTGRVTGTPGYMSPEQVLGDDSGPTTDV